MKVLPNQGGNWLLVEMTAAEIEALRQLGLDVKEDLSDRHRCSALADLYNPDVATVQRSSNDGRWHLTLRNFDSGKVFAETTAYALYCPWCGVKLE